jgi:HEAT repeat protein
MTMTIQQLRVLLGSDEPNYPLIRKLLQPDDVSSLETLAHGPEEMLASKAAYSISLLGTSDALQAMQRLASSPKVDVRVAVSCGLSHLAGLDVAPLAERLLSDADTSVRKGAIKASRALNLASLRSVLQRVANADKVPAMRAMAKGVVDGLRDP